MTSLSKKKNFYVIVGSIVLFVTLGFYAVVSKNVDSLRSDLSFMDSQLRQASANEGMIKSYLAYKKKFGDIEFINVEPVFLRANFDLKNALYKINSIIDSTYKGKGYFFLEEFSIGKDIDKDDEDEDFNTDDNNKDYASIVIKGKKVMLFAR